MQNLAEIWKQEEINYIYENVGAVNLYTIAKNLNRPIQGVQLKMKRLKIGNTKEQLGLFTIGSLARVINVDRSSVKHWVTYHGLLVTKKRTCKTKVFYFIESNHFWNWAFNHQDRIDFSKIEPHVILPEPEWVDSLRFQKRKIKGNHYRSWTTKEEKMLLELKSQNKSYKSIAEILNRTAISIERKYKRLVQNECL